MGIGVRPCCCNPNCTIINDNFGFTGNFSNWTQVGGTWTYNSFGGFTPNIETTTSDTYFICNTANPSGISALNWGCNVQLQNFGDAARLIADYQDASNFLYLEIVANSTSNSGTDGTVNLYRMSGGSSTLIATGNTILATQGAGGAGTTQIITGNSMFMQMCFSKDGSQVNCVVGQGLFPVCNFIATVNATNTGVFGVGSGTLTTGSPAFKVLASGGIICYRTDAGCPECLGCTACTDFVAMGKSLTVVVSGIIPNSSGSFSGSYPCCNDLNGTFVLNWSTSVGDIAYYMCIFTYNFGPSVGACWNGPAPGNTPPIPGTNLQLQVRFKWPLGGHGTEVDVYFTLVDSSTGVQSTMGWFGSQIGFSTETISGGVGAASALPCTGTISMPQSAGGFGYCDASSGTYQITWV